ncbi:MAG: hypothetical protein HPY69_05390 [Armatimonadetes bacterium]|nr:hypothetical protein [Armatimonadota bacterium]
MGLMSILLAIGLTGLGAQAQEPLNIGSRLELLVDDALIDTLSGGARQVLHHPAPQDVALVCDEPWEGNATNYVTVFRDGELYRMYYRGVQVTYARDSITSPNPEVTCMAVSADGIHWVKPRLGLFEFAGSRDNNIVWMGNETTRHASHNFTPFRDTNPACPPEARYKALGGLGGEGGGLWVFKSPDGVHWSLLHDKPVITEGAFDSQNLAFWDSLRGEYREYHRSFRDGRDIMTCTSKDFVNWTAPVFLEYTPGRTSELYTNQITPYHRAPHLFLGFPTRYLDRGWSPSTEALPQLEYRQLRAAISQREGTAITDGMFMASRDGLHFRIWPESFIRPGLRTEYSWFYGDNYQNWGLVETPSTIVGAPDELSIYVTEGTLQGDKCWLRRYTLRTDGFVSVQAPLSGGELVTKPLVFSGGKLVLNFSTGAAGRIRVEVQDEAGQPLPGLTLADCPEVFGDDLARVVPFRDPAALAALAGKPVRLRFELCDADLYAFRFTD